MQRGLIRVLRLFWRAVRRRCPNCGGRPIFQSWLRMRKSCPVCGLPLERGEEGYQVGAYMFNIIAAELAFAAVFVGVMVATWPTPPWDPFSKTIFLAFDLVFRPAESSQTHVGS